MLIYFYPQKKIDEESARKIFLQLFSAIQYCHREKIIHRDLKLENIMFSNKNYDTIKVVDFGISAQQSLINIDYTQAGSARYFAPEVLSTKAPAHPSIDIWAMGCILFWMIIGQSPFSQNTKEEVFNNILKGNYSIPSEAKPKITKSVQDLIHKMLQVDVESRITMTEMAQHQWLKNSVEEIKEIERIEREEHLKLLRIQKSSQNQRRSFNNQFNSASKIQIGVSNLLNNTQSINKVDIVRRKEGFKTIMNTPSASFFNQLNLRKNSLNLQEQDKQKAEDITPKFDATKYQLIIASYQKKHLQQKKLPQIKEQQQINSNQKKIQSQRTLKVCKDRPQNFSQIESPLPNNNYGINSPGLLGQIGGLMTPKQMNTPTPLRNQFAPNIQSSNNYKTPKQKQGEIYVNENNYSVNKTYNSQVNLQNKQLFVNNTNNQQNEYLLKVNNNFSNIINSQMKIMNDKITPLQTPSSTKNKQPIMQQFKDLNPNLLRKNDSKFTQQKLIQITNNTPPIQSFTELDSIQNNKFSFLNTSNNNLQPLKNRNSHLFIDASQQFALCQQNLEQESQIIKIQPSKRIYTHN